MWKSEWIHTANVIYIYLNHTSAGGQSGVRGVAFGQVVVAKIMWEREEKWLGKGGEEEEKKSKNIHFRVKIYVKAPIGTANTPPNSKKIGCSAYRCLGNPKIA